MKQTISLLLCLALLLAACTTAPSTIETKDTTQSTDSTYSSQEQEKVSDIPVAPVQDQLGASPSSGLSNIPQQDAENYRSGKTLQIPITITASGFDPKILTVGHGDRVKLTITNDDTKSHTFNIEAYSIAKTLAPDETVLVEFYGTIKGEFKYDDTSSTNDGTLIVGGKT